MACFRSERSLNRSVESSDGDLAAQFRVAGPIHLTHVTDTDRHKNFVRAKSIACGQRQVSESIEFSRSGSTQVLNYGALGYLAGWSLLGCTSFRREHYVHVDDGAARGRDDGGGQGIGVEACLGDGKRRCRGVDAAASMWATSSPMMWAGIQTGS